MSTVRLLVLGACRRHGRVHGYAVHRELADWRIETWTRVRPGSVYHALGQLTTEGKLRAVGEEPGARGPGRTVYELTPAGETEFVALLETALSSFAIEELGTGVAFMDQLPREHVLRLLGTTHERLVAARDGLRMLLAQHPDRTPPPHTRDLLELWIGDLTATAHWLEALRHRVGSGAYRLAGDPG
jgi:DNA-binding PadR family transcriptional regulator